MKTSTYNYILGFLWFATEKCKCKADAEDVIQDVSIKILSRIDWFEALHENEKRNYVMAAIHNRNIDFIRYKRQAKRDPFYHGHPVNKTNPEVYAKMELKEVKEKSLNYKLCQSLFLNVEEGYTCAEIGVMTGKSTNTILGQVRYARKYLKAS